MSDNQNTPENQGTGNPSSGASGGAPKVPNIPGISVGGPVRKKRVSISTPSVKGKKIQRKWWLVGGGGLVVVVAAATMLAPHPHKAPPPKAQVKQISIVPTNINNATFDRHTEATLHKIREKYRAVENNQAKLASTLQKSEEQQKQMAKLIHEQSEKLNAQQRLLQEKAAAQNNAVSPSMAVPPPPPPTLTGQPPVSPYPVTPGAPMPQVSVPPQVSSSSQANSALGYDITSAPSAASSQSGVKVAESIQKNPYAGFIPAGSFLPAVLLTGVDANTATSTAGNPEPVLMRIQRKAVLPNGGSYNLAGCFVIGSATGSISSRRADIRLATLSCVNKKHQEVLQANIKGYAVDSDGKFGLRGTLVERRGSLLEKSLLAGFASGLGSAFSDGTGSSYDSSIGTGQVISGLGQGLQAGALNGVGDAMNQLAQFYLNQAKNIFPVIDVPAGRKITLVIVKGASYEWHNAHSRYILARHPVKLQTPVKAHSSATPVRRTP